MRTMTTECRRERAPPTSGRRRPANGRPAATGAAYSADMIRRHFHITIALVVALLAAAGCGGGSGDSAPAGASLSQAGGAGMGADGASNGGTGSGASGSGSGSGAGSGTASGTGGTSDPGSPVTYGNLSSAAFGAGASLKGALPFPADNPWNTDISNAPVDPSSNALIASIGLTRGLHPDFGSGLYDGAPIGIPYVVVGAGQPKVAIHFTAYGSQSDPGPYPIPPDAAVEGEQVGVPGSGGDRHLLVIDRDNQRLYELFRAFPNGDGSWNADSAAVFHLDSNTVRPTAQPGWTSADAAGLPIFPGLARYDEAASGVIRHALRFTAAVTRKAYVPPATHWASSTTDPNRPPMGMRVRLKASFEIPASFSTESRALLQAMKTYGMLLADNGSNWYVSGAPDPRWNNSRLLAELGQAKGSDFEVVRMDGLVTP